MFSSFSKFTETVQTWTSTAVESVNEQIKVQRDEYQKFQEENERKKEQDEKRLKRQLDHSHPPWVIWQEEKAILAEELKNQILKLSEDSRTFSVDAPKDTVFHFDMEAAAPYSVEALKEDENLKDMRFQLVPKKVSETTFWRNYFYRISLIREKLDVDALILINPKEEPSSSNSAISNQSSSSKNKQTSPSSSSSPNPNEKKHQQDGEERKQKTRSPSSKPSGTDDFVSDDIHVDSLDPTELGQMKQELGELDIDSLETMLADIEVTDDVDDEDLEDLGDEDLGDEDLDIDSDSKSPNSTDLP